ncbi:MAG: tetratricopeptide repeat protein [Candidatus Cloacimonetes bacterium]|nr:tetratricopeptide repeat protein [Candidatus Cloacimonadota bacterium]
MVLKSNLKFKTGRHIKIFFLIILIISISFLILLSGTNKEEAEKHYYLGIEYYEQGLIDKAIEEFRLAIQYNQDYAAAYYNIGNAYEFNGNYDKAIEYFLKAISLDPSIFYFYRHLGDMYYYKGYYDKAIENYYKALSLIQEDTITKDISKQFIYLYLGFAYHHKGNYDKAIEEYKLAIKYKPDFAIAHYNLGVVYGKKLLTDKAIGEYKLAIKYKPDYAKAHLNLGGQYFNKTLYDEAIKEYEIALNYTQDDLDKVDLYGRLGLLYNHPKENYDKSIEYYKKALNIQPENEIIYINIGTVYDDKGDYSKAIEYYQKAIEINPDYAEAYYNMGIAYYSKGWKTSAADYLYQAGLIYLGQKDRQKVLRQIDFMKDLVPDSPLIPILMEKLYAEDVEQTPKEKDIGYSGSGFIINNDGFIVTNYHIIEGMENIDIYFPSNDKQYKVEIVIKDINNDIALLKINDSRFTKVIGNIPFGLGSSSDIKVGQEVFTIGFPLEDILGKSAKLSTGLVNSLYGILDDPTLIQISNPIQPGNSGGALFNSNGDVIGIVIASLNAKYFYENTDIIPQNVNFAIKVDYLRNLISMLPDGEEILNRKSQISNLPLETQFDRIKPFVVNIKAY